MLKNQIALITGGTRGIGRAVSLLLAGQQAQVFAWYRSDTTAATTLEQECPAIRTAAVDVRQREAVRAGVKSIVQSGGRIDVLVNCAGTSKDGWFAMMADADWDSVLESNLSGTRHVCQEVVRDMIYHRSGRIVNLASLSGVTGVAGQTNYSAAKGAIVAFTKALALEVARYHILVNAVSPGLVETEMTQALPEAPRRQMLERIPLGRAGRPEEVARLIGFLVSEENTYLTGQNVVISGGLYT